MELLQNNRSFEGEQRIYRFNSKVLKNSARFGIFLPPQALAATLFTLAESVKTRQGVFIWLI